jgi:hypothetical protein
MKPMEIKVNVDEKSGKITQLTFSGDGFNMDSVQKALSAIAKNFPGTEGSHEPVMAKDILDLAADKYTIKERLRLFLRFEFCNLWFSSIQVKDKYERQYGEEIKISTVSTYLTRLYNEGFLERRGNRVEREYHVIDVNVEDKAVERAAQRTGPAITDIK